MSVYIRGRPMVVTVDDYLPLYNGKPLFLMKNSNPNFWASLFEKVYAKINGMYDNLNYGW
jgi:hypothetical protein